jgi:cobaltochelatase CobS
MSSVSNLEREYVENEIIDEVKDDLGLDDNLTDNDQGYKIIIEDIVDFKRVLWESLKYRPIKEEMIEEGTVGINSQVWLKRDTDDVPRLGTISSEPKLTGDDEWQFHVIFLDDGRRVEEIVTPVATGANDKVEFETPTGFKVRTDEFLLEQVSPKAIKGGEVSPTQVYVFKPTNKDVLEMTLISVESKQNEIFKLDGSVFKGADKFAFDVDAMYSQAYQRQALSKDHVNAIVESLEKQGIGTIKKGNATPTVKLDSSTETAINSMLKDTGLTIGALLSNHNNSKQMFNDLAVQSKNSRQINKQLEKMVSDLRNQTAAGHFLPPEITYDPSKSNMSGQKDYPKGEVEWLDAFDVFDPPKSYKDRFNFKVPVWNWYKEDAQGNRTPATHPLVPEKQGNYVFSPDLLPTLLWCLNTNKKGWISGHTGTGKSSLVSEVCAFLNYPLIRINFDSEITRMDLVGRDVLTQENGTTISKFEDGILPQALQQPCVLLCDEIDFIRPDIAYVMQRALEDNGLLITEDGGRLVTPHPYCRIIATANTQGQGDEFGYQGARTQSMAFLDRFTVWLDVEYLPRNQELKLVKARTPDLDDEYVNQILDYVQEHRKAFVDGEIGQPISPRGVLALCEAVQTFTALYSKAEDGLQIAVESTILNKANLQDRNVLKGLVDRMFDFGNGKSDAEKARADTK